MPCLALSHVHTQVRVLSSQPPHPKPPKKFNCAIVVLQCLNLRSAKTLGQQNCRTKVPRIFRISHPEFCPEFCSEVSRILERIFRAFFPGKRRPLKNHQKSLQLVNARSTGEFEEKSTRVFWRAGKVIKPFENRLETSTR